MIQRLVAPLLLAIVLMPSNLLAAQPPSETGQSAFAAIAEIVAALDADESTDWSRVDLLALREHLVDMDEVTLRATVEERPIEGGVGIRVGGSERTREALQRMLPMHAHAVQAESAWRVEIRPRPDGYDIDLTAEAPGEVARLRGLGFFGFLAAGNHHQRHHFGLATGTMAHMHPAGH